MDQTGVAVITTSLVIGGSILGAAWSLASRLGDLAAQVREVATTVKAHGQQLDRIEHEARERASSLSAVRDRLATLEGSFRVGQ